MPRKALMHHDKTNETGLMMRFDSLKRRQGIEHQAWH